MDPAARCRTTSRPFSERSDTDERRKVPPRRRPGLADAVLGFPERTRRQSAEVSVVWTISPRSERNLYLLLFNRVLLGPDLGSRGRLHIHHRSPRTNTRIPGECALCDR